DAALGSDFWRTYRGLSAEPGAAMIRATAADGSTRRFDLEYRVGSEMRSYGVRVARDDTGCVVLALSRSFQMTTNARDRTLEEHNEENAALRSLARQTAEVADTTALLSILCSAASTQCGGHGAMLVSATETDSEGVLVSTVGLLAPAQGRRFPLAGSLARDVVKSRQVAMIEDFAAS